MKSFLPLKFIFSSNLRFKEENCYRVEEPCYGNNGIECQRLNCIILPLESNPKLLSSLVNENLHVLSSFLFYFCVVRGVRFIFYFGNIIAWALQPWRFICVDKHVISQRKLQNIRITFISIEQWHFLHFLFIFFNTKSDRIIKSLSEI